MKFYFHKLGCPKNDVDGDTWISLLLKHGYQRVDSPEDSDIILVNTCGFIDEAKEESIDAILSLAENRAKIYATGCMSELFGKEMLEAMPELDGVLGNRNIPESFRNLIDSHSSPLHSLPRDYGDWYSDDVDINLDTFPYAYLKIAEGCSNRCSYCLLPQIRGAERSLPPDRIVSMAENLLQKGMKELILVAQDTTRYEYKGVKLPYLIDMLSGLNYDYWLRIMYTHPAHIDDKVINAMSKPKVVPYIDMPIQHISDRVLRAMNRKTDGKRIRDIVEQLERAGIAIRTTVMTGFPGETQEDFEQLKDYVSEGHFLHLGAFAFSPQEGTKAFDIPGFDIEVAEERRLEIEELHNHMQDEFNNGLIGEKKIILIETHGEDGSSYGRMAEDAPDIDRQVRVDGKGKPGDFIEAEICAEFGGLFEAETD